MVQPATFPVDIDNNIETGIKRSFHGSLHLIHPCTLNLIRCRIFKLMRISYRYTHDIKARCFDTLEKNLVRCRISPTRFIAGKTSVISHNHRLKRIHSGFHQCRQLHGSQITHPCIIRCNVFIVCRYAI